MSEFKTYFNPDDYYEFVIDDQGPVVYSECCADRMTLEVARKVYHALDRWIWDVRQKAAETCQHERSTLVALHGSIEEWHCDDCTNSWQEDA